MAAFLGKLALLVRRMGSTAALVGAAALGGLVAGLAVGRVVGLIVGLEGEEVGRRRRRRARAWPG